MSAFNDDLDEISVLKAKLAAMNHENEVLRAAKLDSGFSVQDDAPFPDTSGYAAEVPQSDGGNNSGGRRRRGNDSSGADGGTSGGRQRRGGGGGNEGSNGDKEEYDGRTIWVKADSTTRIVERSITGAALPDARKGFPVYVFSKYDKNTNTGIKGVISAQRILKDRYDMSIGVFPSFRDNRNELTLKVVPLEAGEQPPHVANPALLDTVHHLSVASKTDPKVLAGAIAGQARAGSVLAVRAIGAKAVFEMLRACAVAREYLENDGKGQDLVCFPDFVEVELEGRNDPTNALRLLVTMTVGSPVTVDPSA